MPLIRRSLVLPLFSILAGLGLWEFLGRVVIDNPYAFAPFSEVIIRLIEMEAKENLWLHVGTSYLEFTLGFGGAALTAIPLGLILATVEPLREMADPWISLLYSTPLIALAPLFIIMFGLGITAKVVVVYMLAFFPILINTMSGIRTTEPVLIEAGRAFGASRMQLFRTVLLPHSTPFILTGLRLGVGRAFLAIVVAEMFGAKAGLGFLVWLASQKVDPAMLLAAVVMLSLSGYLSMRFFVYLEQKLAPWRHFEM